METKKPLVFNRIFLSVTGFYASDRFDRKIYSFATNIMIFFILVFLGVYPCLHFMLMHLNEVNRSVNSFLVFLSLMSATMATLSFALQKAKVTKVFDDLEAILNRGRAYDLLINPKTSIYERSPNLATCTILLCAFVDSVWTFPHSFYTSLHLQFKN